MQCATLLQHWICYTDSKPARKSGGVIVVLVTADKNYPLSFFRRKLIADLINITANLVVHEKNL